MLLSGSLPNDRLMSETTRQSNVKSIAAILATCAAIGAVTLGWNTFGDFRNTGAVPATMLSSKRSASPCDYDEMLSESSADKITECGNMFWKGTAFNPKYLFIPGGSAGSTENTITHKGPKLTDFQTTQIAEVHYHIPKLVKTAMEETGSNLNMAAEILGGVSAVVGIIPVVGDVLGVGLGLSSTLVGMKAESYNYNANDAGSLNRDEITKLATSLAKRDKELVQYIQDGLREMKDYTMALVKRETSSAIKNVLVADMASDLQELRRLVENVVIMAGMPDYGVQLEAVYHRVSAADAQFKLDLDSVDEKTRVQVSEASLYLFSEYLNIFSSISTEHIRHLIWTGQKMDGSFTKGQTVAKTTNHPFTKDNLRKAIIVQELSATQLLAHCAYLKEAHKPILAYYDKSWPGKQDDAKVLLKRNQDGDKVAKELGVGKEDMDDGSIKDGLMDRSKGKATTLTQKVFADTDWGNGPGKGPKSPEGRWNKRHAYSLIVDGGPLYGYDVKKIPGFQARGSDTRKGAGIVGGYAARYVYWSVKTRISRDLIYEKAAEKMLCDATKAKALLKGDRLAECEKKTA